MSPYRRINLKQLWRSKLNGAVEPSPQHPQQTNEQLIRLAFLTIFSNEYQFLTAYSNPVKPWRFLNPARSLNNYEIRRNRLNKSALPEY